MAKKEPKSPKKGSKVNPLRLPAKPDGLKQITKWQ